MKAMAVACAAATFALLVAIPNVAAADVRVHGATTVTFGLMQPHQAEIEKRAGVALSILPSSTSHGLADLAQGKADIAMLAEPLESAAETLNSKQPGSVRVEELVGRHVGNAYTQFIVHPSNPARYLTNAQLAGLFSGKVKNWSELGGESQTVLAIGEPTSSPHKIIKEKLRIAYAPDLRIVQNVNQTAMIVAQAPGAISYLSSAHDLPVRKKIKVVETELKIQLQLHVAYRKDAPDDVRRVIEAAASIGRR